MTIQRADTTHASDFFSDPATTSKRVEEVKKWVQEKGVREFDTVPLYAEKLEKVRAAEFLCVRSCSTRPQRKLSWKSSAMLITVAK